MFVHRLFKPCSSATKVAARCFASTQETAGGSSSLSLWDAFTVLPNNKLISSIILGAGALVVSNHYGLRHLNEKVDKLDAKVDKLDGDIKELGRELRSDLKEVGKEVKELIKQMQSMHERLSILSNMHSAQKGSQKQDPAANQQE